jgi:hypothetical protein
VRDDAEHLGARRGDELGLPALRALLVVAPRAVQRRGGGVGHQQGERAVRRSEGRRCREADAEAAHGLAPVDERHGDVRLRIAHGAELLVRPRIPRAVVLHRL